MELIEILRQKRTIKQSDINDNAPEYTPEKIIEFICHYLGVSHKALRSRLRNRNVVYARYCYYFIAKNLTNLSLEKIGAELLRGHDTVIHGLKQVKNKYNKELYKLNKSAYRQYLEL